SSPGISPTQLVMQRPIATIVLTILSLPAWGPKFSMAQAPIPPAPRFSSEGDNASFSPSDFHRVLSQLKAERDGLDVDWKSLTKRLKTRIPSNEPNLEKLHEQLKQTLARLQQERMKTNIK